MLQIRNPRVDELVNRLASRRGVSKAEIVPDALEREWARVEHETSLEERLRPLQDFVATHSKTGLAADKAFFDELSGDS